MGVESRFDFKDAFFSPMKAGRLDASWVRGFQARVGRGPWWHWCW